MRLAEISKEIPDDAPLPPNEMIRLAIREIGYRKKLMEEGGESIQQEYLSICQKIIELKQYQPAFEEIKKKVSRILHSPQRSSSCVEGINARVRTVQQIKRKVSQEYLWLLAFKLNCTPFRHGKRAGNSPYQLLGVHQEPMNWVELLRPLV